MPHSHAPFLDPDDLRMPNDDESLLTHPGYAVWQGIAPLPHPRLMLHVGAESVENFLVVGDAWGQLISHLATPNGRILDIGCGCGRTARTLLHHPHVAEYVGFDVVRAYPRWCNAYLSPPTGGRFHFHHVDVHSERYNPAGEMSGAEVVFPVASGSMTLAFGASLFTHLHESDARRYVQESRRALQRGGLLVASIHDAHDSVEKYQGDEHRTEVSAEYFIEFSRELGFEYQRTIPDLCGQRVLVFVAVEPG